MKIINFFAGPGCGKSTLAARTFSEMKTLGYKVELVTEYAKDMVYESRLNILEDQLYVLAKQARRISRLKDHVDYVVTDSPLLLSKVYNNGSILIDSLSVELFNEYHNYNYFLTRTKPYSNYGRSQTEDQAKNLDNMVYNTLNDLNIDFYSIPGDVESYKTIIERLYWRR